MKPVLEGSRSAALWAAATFAAGCAAAGTASAARLTDRMTARIIVLSFPGSEGFLAGQYLDRAASRAAYLRTGAGPMAMGTPGERPDRRGVPIRDSSRSHRHTGRAASSAARLPHPAAEPSPSEWPSNATLRTGWMGTKW